MKILLTGVAGFIGMHVAKRLLEDGHSVTGLDNLNDYYDVQLKYDRLNQLDYTNFRFLKCDITETSCPRVIRAEQPDRVVHLAAQAGVRYSLTNPYAYISANLMGFMHVLEGCRQAEVDHLVYASSSSVFGRNGKVPFSECDPVDHPVSLYAATKKANELMAHTYSHLYALPATGLRFFTVYGPWGRPDMAPMKFTDAIVRGLPIDVYNHGNMLRDFTFIDDIVEGVVRVLDQPAQPNDTFDPMQPDAATSWAPYCIYNIGNHTPVLLLDFIAALEQALERKASKNFLPMQPGDVPVTFADTTRLQSAIDFAPKTPLIVGVQRFVDWYQDYYGITPVWGADSTRQAQHSHNTTAWS